MHLNNNYMIKNIFILQPKATVTSKLCVNVTITQFHSGAETFAAK